MKCRISKEKCIDFIDFGKMPMANALYKIKIQKSFYFL